MAASTAAREAATLDPMAGRAKVRDDDRLRAFYRELEAHEAGALWTVLNALEPDHPTAAAMQRLEDAADSGAMACGRMLGESNPEGNTLASAAAALVARIHVVERAAVAPGAILPPFRRRGRCS